MSDPQPTAADLALAEEIFRDLGYSTAFGQERRVAASIARYRAESEAALRQEIERLRAERDELLAACKAVLAFHGSGELPEHLTGNLEAAIARVEAGRDSTPTTQGT